MNLLMLWNCEYLLGIGVFIVVMKWLLGIGVFIIVMEQ